MADQNKKSDKPVEKAAMQPPDRSKQVPQCLSPNASDKFDTRIHQKMLRALNEPDNIKVSMDKNSSKINNQRNPQISEDCDEVFPDFPILMDQPPQKKIKKNETITHEEEEEEKKEKKDKGKPKMPVKAVVQSQRKKSKAPATIKGSNTTKTDKKLYKCPQCSKEFSKSNNLQRHMLVHSDVRPFVCNVQGCGRSFQDASNLKRHQTVHTNVRAYSCSVGGCAQSFKTAGDLKEHVTRHTDQRPFVCNALGCDKAFKIAKDLQNHMKRHSDDRPFACVSSGCNKTFKAACDLKTHMISHSDEHPFACEFFGCNRSYKKAIDLRHHMFTHSSENKYSCEDCPYTIHYAQGLSRHKKLHTGKMPYRCDKCDYGCTMLSTIKNHMQTHTDDRPFICSICQFATKSQLLLKSHSKVHQGPQPHQCNICPFRTADKNDLDRHHRISHNKNKTLTCAHCPRVCSSPQALQQHEILHAVSTGTRHNPNTILNYLDQAPENGTQRCTTPNCITCNYILSRNEIPLSMDDEDYDNYSIPTLFNCKSKCVIYLISCSKCGAKYIGETARELRERFGEHLRAFADKCDRNLYEHFNQADHSEENIHVEVLCNASTDPQQRRIQESSFMLMFATYGRRNSLNKTISRILF